MKISPENSLFNEILGRNISAARIKNRLTQMQLGCLLTPAVSGQAIQKYESGMAAVTAERLTQLASVLNCPVDDLLANAPQLPVNNEILKYQKLTKNFGLLPKEAQNYIIALVVKLAKQNEMVEG